MSWDFVLGNMNNIGKVIVLFAALSFYIVLYSVTMVTRNNPDPLRDETKDFIGILNTFLKCTVNGTSINPLIIKGVYKATNKGCDFLLEKSKQRNYSAISVTVPNYLNDTVFVDKNGVPDEKSTAWSYLFLVPLTAMSWKRLNRTTIVLVTLNVKELQPDAKELFLHVHQTLLELGVKILIFDTPSNLMVRMSQLLRLIPATLGIFKDDDFIITSDADLWPLNDTGLYEVNAGKKIKVYNSQCCGLFEHRGKKQRMYPMSHFDMPAKIWNNFMQDEVKFTEHDKKKIHDVYFRNAKTESFEYIEYNMLQNFIKSLENYSEGLKGYTKKSFYQKATHGGPLWDLDQSFFSTKLYNYIELKGTEEFEFHEPTCRRIHSWDWNTFVFENLTCFYDAHVFKAPKPFVTKTWKIMMDLPKILFDEESIDFLESYRNRFVELYNYRPKSVK